MLLFLQSRAISTSLFRTSSLTRQSACPCRHQRNTKPRPVRFSALQMSFAAPFSGTPTIVVTNDDGIDPNRTLAVPLAVALANLGHDVTVVAPGRNISACGMSITLYGKLTLIRHPSIEESFSPRIGTSGKLRVFSVSKGTPADCVSVAIDPGTGLLKRMGLYPRAVVSGVNIGPNIGSDVLYSGTVAGARQAAIYGVPGIACSLATMKYDVPDREEMLARAVRISVRVVQSAIATLPDDMPPSGRREHTRGVDCGLRDLFCRGDILLNVNIPARWGGKFAATTLDSIMYHDIVQFDAVAEGKEETFQIKGGRIGMGHLPGSDAAAVKDEVTSVTTLQSFPWSHPLWVPEDIMSDSLLMDEESGLPRWITSAVPAVAKR